MHPDSNEPESPSWLAGVDPFIAEERTDEFNARIYGICQDRSWQSVYRAWREGFLCFLEWSEAVPEVQLLDAKRYPWLKGYPLSAVLQGSCGHHEEHLESLID